MKKVMLPLFISLAFLFSTAFAAKKLKFEPNFTGNYDGTFTDGNYNLDIAGAKVTGTLKTKEKNTPNGPVRTIVGELTYKDKPLKFESTTTIKMEEGVATVVKTYFEDFKLTYDGKDFLTGTVYKDVLTEIQVDLDLKGKTVKGKQPLGIFKLEFGDLKMKGKRTGLMNQDFDLSFGDKKVPGYVEIKMDIFKKTMKCDFFFKADGLTDDETILLIYTAVLSDIYSGRAN